MTHPDQDDDPNRCRCCGRVLSQGWTLCDRDSTKLGEGLLEIADRYARLSAVPSMQPGRYDQGRSGTPGSRPSANLTITALTDFRSGQTEPAEWEAGDGKVHREPDHDTPAVLRAVLGWCQTVGDERGFTTEPWLPEGQRGERRQRRTVSSAPDGVLLVEHAARWLTRQDEWLARWEEAGELAGQVRRLRNRLRSACGDRNPAPVGACFRAVGRPDGTTAECGAPIFLPEPVRDPAPGVRASAGPVRCASRHRHEYEPHDLMRLRVINEAAERDKREAS